MYKLFELREKNITQCGHNVSAAAFEKLGFGMGMHDVIDVRR